MAVIFYTCNYLETQNPTFWENTQKQFKESVGDLQVISVSHKPMDLGINICVGDIGRGHLNIYYQILTGCKRARDLGFKYVAMAEDDILYSYAHFHTMTPFSHNFLYDMQKLSLFTWTNPPQYSFRTNRRVINQMIAETDLLIEALEERFKRAEELRAMGWIENDILSKWGDIGRYEEKLGVTKRKVQEFYSEEPSIVFTHPKAFGYEFNHGKRKRLGDIKMYDIPKWGRAKDLLKTMWGDHPLL